MNTPATAERVKAQFLRTGATAEVIDKARIGFDSIGHIDRDEDLGFQLRGHGYNPLVDGALPLFGLVIRLRGLAEYRDIQHLYATVRDQISTLAEEIRQYGYDGATQLAYRYALCTFIDEAVMGTAWGAHSPWAERSLLSINHSETWGGEKFFTVLSRMMMDAARYRDVLEFKYLCLCLGFKGKYGLQHNQNEALQVIIVKLHRMLRELRGETPETLTDASTNVASRRYRVGRQWPWWTPWAGAALLLAGVYAAFALSLGSTTEIVLHSLDGILKN
ncbi:type IVB secretion system protein IcmH/DotU [Achromobacter spanius]|jgi:type VI secretion system protein ImpK|uniref:type IVB secretion system protein IcmH/DotU n=1 Tax=Achromobacter TaxID=222 RepID=UPI001E466ED8|nr:MULTISPECIES: type IVB secretion system protein IcmH/DotU [Achromobacter]MCD0499422.1 type IVB secretion system protein IcmH/DotU [Achromobacter sp. MY14]MCW3154972.1 type IVB secretion system protein IcmH/DotU [Achromobacter spanius]